MAVGMRQAEGQRQFLFSFGRAHLLLGNGTAVGLWGAKHSLGLWSHRGRARVVSEHVGRYSRSLPLFRSGAPDAHLGLISTMAQANYMAKPS